MRIHDYAAMGLIPNKLPTMGTFRSLPRRQG